MRSTIELYPLNLDLFERTKGAGMGGIMPRGGDVVLRKPPLPRPEIPTASHSSKLNRAPNFYKSFDEYFINKKWWKKIHILFDKAKIFFI